MELRLRRTAEELGVPADGIELLARAHGLAMEIRRAELPGQRHPDFLHPGRSALILLLDTGTADVSLLAAALLVESERGDLRVDGARIRTEVGMAVADLVQAVPIPSVARGELAERLVVSEGAVRLVCLAERLDQLRHAHLWPDGDDRRRAHTQAVEVYGPVADRTHPALSRRYAWWIRTFARKHL